MASEHETAQDFHRIIAKVTKKAAKTQNPKKK